MDQIERISAMEAALDAASAAVAGLEQALEAYLAAQEQVEALDEYYAGDDWRRDFEDDEAGLLPADLKRGVLSEDAVYDLLEDNRELAFALIESATDVLRAY